MFLICCKNAIPQQDAILYRIALIAVLLFLAMNVLCGSLSAKTITGRVVSASDNEPLMSATLIVEGKQGGLVTDLDGNYSIEAEDGQTLVFSYISFLSKKVKVSKQCYQRCP